MNKFKRLSPVPLGPILKIKLASLERDMCSPLRPSNRADEIDFTYKTINFVELSNVGLLTSSKTHIHNFDLLN